MTWRVWEKIIKMIFNSYKEFLISILKLKTVVRLLMLKDLVKSDKSFLNNFKNTLREHGYFTSFINAFDFPYSS